MQKNHKEDRTKLIIFCIIIIISFLVIWLLSPYFASFLLNSFKRFFEVHIMYGSTSGKSLLIFPFILFSLIFSRWVPNINFKKVIPLIFLISLFLWYHSFSIIGDINELYGLDFEDGNHVQICDDTYYNEFISYAHPHSYKAIAHELILSKKTYITGEALNNLYSFSKFWPSLFILISFFFFLFGLKELGSFYSILSYILGYYMVFLSYFDGGLFSGFLGFFFMQNTYFNNSFSKKFLTFHHIRYLVFILLMFIIYLLFCLLNQVPINIYEIFWFTFNSIQSRYIIFIFLLIFLAPKKFYLLLLILILLFVNNDHWHAHERYEDFLNEGEIVLMSIYSDRVFPDENFLLRFNSFSLFEYNNSVYQSKWDLCQSYMYQLEGRSYRSLNVNVYCTIFRSNNHVTEEIRTNDGIQYKVLRKNSCDIDCYDLLNKYFVVNGSHLISPNGFNTLHSRSQGVPFCFNNNTIIVTKNHNTL